MALVVEDGTGLEDANSYASLEFANHYFDERGNSVWADADSEQKQFALIRSTDYIDTRFSGRFLSCPLKSTQALAFPREAWQGVPIAVRKACVEYALRALTQPLAPDPQVDPTGLTVVSRTRKVDVIENSVTYSSTKSPDQFRPYPMADNLLRPFLGRSGRVIR